MVCTSRSCKEAQQRRFPVVFAVAAEELWVGEDPAPACADKGGAGECRWLWREAEKDLLEEILVVQGC